MSYELKIIPGTELAFFCWSGDMTLKDREVSRDHIVRFCKERSISKIILDTRKQINKTQTMQLFDFVTALPEHMRSMCIAIIRHAMDKEIQFAENVAANRGANIRSFLTLEDAQSWLESETVLSSKSNQNAS